MEGFIYLPSFINTAPILPSIKALPYGYDAVDEFNEHQRYWTERHEVIPDFIQKLTLVICNYLNVLSSSTSFVYDERLMRFILINRYEKGEGCSWHQDFDDERFCDSTSDWAVRFILHIGPDKIFQIRDLQTKTVQDIKLKSGDAMLMSEPFDQEYEHNMPIPGDDLIRYTFMTTFEIPKTDLARVFLTIRRKLTVKI